MKKTPLMDDTQTVGNYPMRRLHLQQIHSFAPSCNIEVQHTVFAAGLKHRLSQQVVYHHMSHTLGFHLQALVSGIGIDGNGEGQLLSNSSGRIIHRQIELVRMVLRRSRRRGTVDFAIIGIETLVIHALLVGGIVGVRCG